MLRAIVPVVLAGLLTASASAQEKYTIKVRKDVKGDVVKIAETESEKGMMKITFNGMTMPKDESKSITAEYTEKIIDKETGKRATKLERTYTKAEMAKEGAKITPSFVGKTVLIERTGATYKFSVDNKEVTGDDAKFLVEEFKEKKKDSDGDVEDVLLPKEAIAVKGTWKPDVATLVKEFTKSDDTPLSIDAAKATATGKFLNAYKKDGKQYGTLEIEVMLPLKEIGAGAMKITLEGDSNVKVIFKYDGCIDGTTTAGKLDIAMDMKMIGTLKTPDGAEVKLDAVMKKNGTKTQEMTK